MPDTLTDEQLDEVERLVAAWKQFPPPDPYTALTTASRHLTALVAKVRRLRRLRPETCGRTEDHLAHGIPMTVHCPGVGEQVCRPESYEHLGPWEHVTGSDSLNKCGACGTVIGK
jgi:hypothetical protein